MPDKNLIKARFKKSLKTYNDNAGVQSIMAERLVLMLGKTKFGSVFEIGCGTGILTAQIKNKIVCAGYTGNDIVCGSKAYIKKIMPECRFITGDIEEISAGLKYDLIISNACLQWCGDFAKTLDKLMNMLNPKGLLAFSVFGNRNLEEVKNIFDVGLNYYRFKEFKDILSKYNVLTVKEDIETIYFNDPRDVLRHLKYTGVNIFSSGSFNKRKLKEFEEVYKKNYLKDNKVSLTYHPFYAVLRAD